MEGVLQDQAGLEGSSRGSWDRELHLVLAIAWRNLWRSKRRTWLTAGGIAFAIWLLSFGSAANYGTFNAMIRAATDLLLGHVQIQHEDFVETESARYRVPDATQLLHRVERLEGVQAASPRVQVGALISFQETSVAGLVMGVDFEREPSLSTLPNRITEGRYLEAGDEAVIGSGLARRLGMGLGDELVVLGSGMRGGVAAMVQRIVGIFETGLSELDRGLVQLPLAPVQAAFDFGDEANAIIVATSEVQEADGLAEVLNSELPAPLFARSWNEIDPRIQQMLDLKIAGLGIFFGICVLMIGFSVLNSLLMSVFERTREFGVMTALGLRRNSLFVMLQLEGLMCSLLGCGLAALALAAMFAAIGSSGIPLPEDVAATFGELGMGSRLLIEFDLGTYLIGAGVMIAATEAAALIACIRLKRFSPIAALRAE